MQPRIANSLYQAPRAPQMRWPAALLVGVTLLLAAPLAAQDAHAKQRRRSAAERRCRGTVGGWCTEYFRQGPARPWRPVPRGSKECPGGCNAGNCNHDTGLCDCPAGWQGLDCSLPLKRPCTNRFRDAGSDEPYGHIDANGRDLNPLAEGYTESRCIGICDADVARCFCDGKYKPIPAPPGSPPGTPPVFRGRPLGNHACQPSDDGKGNPLPWGQVPWQDLYGPQGWCEADVPKFQCPCMYDGFGGPLCDQVLEMYCPSQCSGHGECNQGFCRCHDGWYGTDCARKRAGVEVEEGLDGSRPWLQGFVNLPPALQSLLPNTTARASSGRTLRTQGSSGCVEGSSGGGGSSRGSGGSGSRGGGEGAEAAGGARSLKSAERVSPIADAAARRPRLKRRPLVYVYDLPAVYNTRMLQYRVDRGLCVWRSFHDGNETAPVGWTYAIETLFHEMLLQSNHRTFDPEEADFFYMPVYSSCFIFPIHCWADGPWWYSPSGPRVMHVTNMMMEARDWVRSHFPYWDRRGGRDHIWLMSHDEGACYAPTDIYNASIFLTHWGRMDLQHRSNTAYTPDNYTQEWEDRHQPGGWLRLIKDHPCYTPGKDLVIPALKFPAHFSSSPLLAAPPQLPTEQADPTASGPGSAPKSGSEPGFESGSGSGTRASDFASVAFQRSRRDILAFFRGDVGKHRLPHYSRGIRQRLYRLSQRDKWGQRYKILIGEGQDVPGSYSELLARSKFCLVMPGDGWSPRAEDAVLHGCVPVVIMDQVNAVFEPELDWSSFSIRVKESEAEQLPELLQSISAAKLRSMQVALRKVWHRFAYTRHPLLTSLVDQQVKSNLRYWSERDQLRVQLRVQAGRGRRRLAGNSQVQGQGLGEGVLEGDQQRGGGPTLGEQGSGEEAWEDVWWAWEGEEGEGDHARAEAEGTEEEEEEGMGEDLEGMDGTQEQDTLSGPGQVEGVESVGARQRRSLTQRDGAGGVDRVRLYPHEDDAFGTIMQWLYSRIKDTR